MSHCILEKAEYTEVTLTGPAKKWEIMKLIFELQRKDPNKERPCIWLLDRHIEFPAHAPPLILQGILNLVVRNTLKSGAKTALVSANHKQHESIVLFCTHATRRLPYPMKAFETTEEAFRWLGI